jgi:3-methylfumaryl-CoA hydratase
MSVIDIEHLRSWVGREQRAQAVLSPFPARALAAAIDSPRAMEEGGVLPVGWQWLYFLDTPSAAGTGEDGHMSKGGFLPPIPLPRRMWASGTQEITRPLRLGLAAEKVSRVHGIELKEGRSGALVFVSLEHTLSQAGTVCIREQQQLVYRAAPTAAAPLPQGEIASRTADWSRTFKADPILLFRFSALTYNAHRIHYDRDYAMHQELYPGLVVHAPLLVILLLDVLTRHVPEADMRSVRFRAIRPTFESAEVSLQAQQLGNEIHLWSSDQDGYVGVSATAQLNTVRSS